MISCFLDDRLLNDSRRTSFSDVPNEGESDMRLVYCAFVISALLDDWSAIDVPRAVAFVKRSRVRHAILPHSTRCAYDSFFRLMKGDMARLPIVRLRVRSSYYDTRS